MRTGNTGTGNTGTGIMPMTDALTLSRWLSPAFPVGAFAWSHGIEAAVAAGRIDGAAGLAAWLSDLLDHGSLAADAVVVAAAHAQVLPLPEIDAEARAFAAAAARLEETAEQGAAFCRTLRDSGGPDLGADLVYPVAVGAAARAAGLCPDLTVTLFLQAAAANLVSAAIRLSVLGQTEGQRVLAGLTPQIGAAAARAAEGDLDRLVSTAFLSDVAAMAHETLQPRLFRS